MILKYRGYMKNWCYMEAPSYTVTHLAFERPTVPESNIPTPEERLRAATIYQHKLDGKIKEEVGLDLGYRLTYLTGDELFEPEQGFAVIIPEDNSEGFVLHKEAYLMTDTGKTIERIA